MRRIGVIDSSAPGDFNEGIAQGRTEALPFGAGAMNMHDVRSTASIAARRVPDVPAFPTQATREVLPRKHGERLPLVRIL